jgi:hypothetical protein
MRFVPNALCDCHPECTHYKGVAEKRFRKALKTVLTQREVKELAGPLYDKRSHTGHRGTLFGSEGPGQLPPRSAVWAPTLAPGTGGSRASVSASRRAPRFRSPPTARAIRSAAVVIAAESFSQRSPPSRYRRSTGRGSRAASSTSASRC